MSDDTLLPERTEFVFVATADELAVMLDVMEKTRLGTITSLFHVALARLAMHTDTPVPTGAFDLRRLHRAATT